jgi:hypothetical protein
MDSQKATVVDKDLLRWRYDPWRARPGRTWALLAVNFAVAAVVYFTFPEKVFVLLALVFMFGATLSMLVPISYRFDADGVTVFFLGTRNFRRWEHYRNCYVHQNGVFLTSMPKPSGLDPFRGHFLLFAGNREEVASYARERIKQ